MSASYESAVESLLSLSPELWTHKDQKPRRKFDLQHMRVVTEALGHPERRFPSIIVGGTNGKGSTSATLAGILRAASYKAGLYTSPHLVRVNERIAIDGETISDAEFAEIHSRIASVSNDLVAKGKLDQHPSFFETLTAMAFEYFASSGIDIAVLEVGIGGRLDATNVVDPLLSVISDVSLDHTEWLGDTLTEIAREKAGIVRPGGTLITLPQHPEVNDELGERVRELNARVVNAAAYVPPISPAARVIQTEDAKLPHNRYSLNILQEETEIDSPLAGRHQLRNLALAIASAVELKRSFGYNISNAAIAEGIARTRWPGRFQVIPGAPETVLDVAHNPAGAWALRSALSARYESEPLTIIFGVMRDKDIAEIAEILFPLADEVIATRVNSPRAASAEEIRQLTSHVGTEITLAGDVADAVQLARSRGRTTVITGSVYLVGTALQLLMPYTS
ncbi:MAG TPA: folylpolyglutamate synthase/dihydrofolate synthase family protein [Terriglobales bacterium]|nr:folylpolyglutamate synthase/dihydrofolate synthase family protein [Terriglobales bacterium]